MLLFKRIKNKLTLVYTKGLFTSIILHYIYFEILVITKLIKKINNRTIK